MTFKNKQYFQVIILMIFFLLSGKVNAQKIDTVSTFSISTYVDAYYAYYTDSAGPGKLQKFPTISPRSNSPGLNTAQVSFLYNADNVRATAVFHYGDIAASTWPQTYNNIMEAHIGFKIYSKLWIDAGFFRSHFGTEYLLPSENMTSSVTVAFYYEPYYESGIRLNFDPTKNLEINLFLLNGYDLFIDNNNKKSFGMGVTYVLNDNWGLGYTNYIGDDSPPTDTTNHLRIAQNIFLNYQRKKIKLQIGGDYYLQQNSDIATESKMAGMYNAVATLQYQWTKQFAIYGRGELFEDPNGYVSTIITDAAGKKTGYKLYGLTAGISYKPTPESYIKLEGRRLRMDKNQDIFNYDGTQRNYRYEVMINGGITFDLLKSIKTKLEP